MRYTNAFSVFVILIVTVLSSLNCSSMHELSSQRSAGKIVIDGSNGEWKNVPAYSGKEAKFMVSVCNDDEYIFVCLTSNDPQTVMQIMRAGLTVWFDKEGSNDKTFGINFPLGMQTGDPLPEMDREKMRDSQSLMKMPEPSLNEMDILGPEKEDRYRIPVATATDMKVKVVRSPNGFMVYELQVPLKKTPQHQYAIEAQNTEIGIGLETGSMGALAGKKVLGKDGSSGGNGPAREEGSGPPPGGGGGGRMPPGNPPGVRQQAQFYGPVAKSEISCSVNRNNILTQSNHQRPPTLSTTRSSSQPRTKTTVCFPARQRP